MAGNRSDYEYMIEMYKRGESPVHLATESFIPDFNAACEWSVFEATRKDPRYPVVLNTEAARIEPRWDPQLGSPYLSGLRAVVSRKNVPDVTCDIPLSYFQNAAKAASSSLVDAGTLKAGEVFKYLVCAYPRETDAAGADSQPAPFSFSVKRGQESLAVDEQSLAALVADSVLQNSEGDGQMPVLIPQPVINEAVDLMRQTGDAETGGILIGHLRRDPDGGELFLEITAQVPARHTEQELTRLTFTPETWAAVDAAISLRGKQEMYVGWWHTHPSGHWCDRCPAETRAKCTIAGKLSGDFFSSHDAALHRTVFPRGFSVALVLSGDCGNSSVPQCSLYGWRFGMVLPRGFHILGADDTLSASAAPDSYEGESNDSSS